VIDLKDEEEDEDTNDEEKDVDTDGEEEKKDREIVVPKDEEED